MSWLTLGEALGSKTAKKIRDYPEYADMLEVKPVSVMGLRTGATKLRIPFHNVSKNRRFIKGVDWALEKMVVPPTQELAKQEKNAEANLKRYQGAKVTDVVAINKRSPAQIARVSSPLHIVLEKMRNVAVKKGGGSARALAQSGDPFWYGVMRLGEVLSEVAPWDAMDEWRMIEIVRLWQKYAGLEMRPDGKLRLPWAKPKNEGRSETHHDKCGKFCAKHKAKTITKNGERYKPVTQMRRIKGAKTRSKKAKPPQEESLISIIGRGEKEVVQAMLDDAPEGWIPLKQIVATKRALSDTEI